MMKENVCFALLARDCKEHLKCNIERILCNSKKFGKLDIIVVENDSVDGTKEYLKEMSATNDNIHVITKDRADDAIKIGDKSGSNHRIKRMACYRNEYLDYINHNMNHRVDYLVVVDSDIAYFDIDSLISAIENAPDDFSALFADGRFFSNFFGHRVFFRYYDLFAFLPKDSANTDLTYREMAMNANLLTRRNIRKYVYFPCDSAFGGIGIYRMEKYSGQLYETHSNARSEYFDAVCEHISFNLGFAKNGTNYICSNLVVAYEKVRRFGQMLSAFIPVKVRLFVAEKILKKERN